MSSVPRNVSRFDPSLSTRSTPQQKLSNIIRRMVQEGKRELRVCLPGKILAVHNSYTVDVQPLLQSQYEASPTPVTLPILPDVPVSMPAGATFSVIYPLAVGDTGLLIFADRSLDAWLASSGGLVDPQDARLHDLTDAIFVPSLVTTAQAADLADPSTSDLVLRNGAATVRIKKSGHVAIGNSGADLASLVQGLASQVQSLALSIATAPTAPGKPVDAGAAQVGAQAAKIGLSASSIASS